MIRKKICNRILTSALVLAMVAGSVATGGTKTVQAEQYTNAAAKDGTKDYIVVTKQEDDMDSFSEELMEEYKNSETTSEVSENLSEKNNIATVSLTDEEVEELRKDKSVDSLEEDFMVEACEVENSSSEKEIHKKITMEEKENKKEAEWNLQMINADKVTKGQNEKNKQVRIAILDSGVDYKTDINLEETISLVPGEEEINPLFMDASGHGTSIAGLIGAKDNADGITGVAPNTSIVSIRVLDDNNASPISRVIEGIYMAIERDVDIINMSFGMDKYSSSFEKAVQDAADAGILIVAAAGNAGETSDSSVQYPAAFEEVLAVGSVDKNGDVAASSSKGEEIDIVAPGELVRSTGMFDSNIVASGTSLAAPQVAGAAALILAQHEDASAELVKEVLCQSANLYGETDTYGAGLLDVKVALDKYDEIKAGYEDNSLSKTTIHNNSAVTVYQDTGCVEGCWSKDNHESLINENYTNVKKGARFPDIEEPYNERTEKSTVNGTKFQVYKFAGMMYNPWWHGYYQKGKFVKKEKDKKYFNGEYKNNYVASYIYITRLANQLKSHETANVPDGITETVKGEIKNDISQIDFVRVYGSNQTDGVKRAFVWGMALHSLADVFAHSTYADGGVISHSKGADSITHHPQRWKHAQKAVESAMKKYKDGSKCGTYADFSSATSATEYKLINIKEYMTETAESGQAKEYASVNANVGLSSNK